MEVKRQIKALRLSDSGCKLQSKGHSPDRMRAAYRSVAPLLKLRLTRERTTEMAAGYGIMEFWKQYKAMYKF